MSSYFNEAGEPLMSPEQMRAEMNAQPDYYCDDCGFSHAGDCYYEDDDEDNEPLGMTDVEADADALAGIGWGTDEDYGYFGEE